MIEIQPGYVVKYESFHFILDLYYKIFIFEYYDFVIRKSKSLLLAGFQYIKAIVFKSVCIFFELSEEFF